MSGEPGGGNSGQGMLACTRGDCWWSSGIGIRGAGPGIHVARKTGTEAPGRVGTLLVIHAQTWHVVVQSFKLTCASVWERTRSTPELSERLPLVALSNIELVDDFTKTRRPEVDTYVVTLPSHSGRPSHWVSAYDGAIENAKASSEIVCFRQTWVVSLSLQEFLVHVAEEIDDRMQMA
ncbi:hypothetical protein FB45DRAFT_141399 [Roridomyces roridus]|uniref:Uncharacterized protein n=1 Tax=Roridomyces roridus TaxID=1738132 RepID=A0AAD7BI11_9AGAR|nr:hypothetical protein FB45DRAFT_141399 [Roridomyces roridus]